MSQQYFVVAGSNRATFIDELSYATQNNWDGAGALPLCDGVLNSASQIWSRYANLFEPEEVTPGKDGSLALVWEKGRTYVYVDIGPGKALHLYYDAPTGKWEGVGSIKDRRLAGRLDLAFKEFGRPASSYWQVVQPKRPTQRYQSSWQNTPELSASSSIWAGANSDGVHLAHAA